LRKSLADRFRRSRNHTGWQTTYPCAGPKEKPGIAAGLEVMKKFT
jgi:hypothetical protein